MVADLVLKYVADLVRATRPSGNGNDTGRTNGSATKDRIQKYVRWGAGPRAGQALVLGAKAWALLAGRLAVTPADIERVALPVLRHRVLPNFAAEAEGVSAEDLIADVLSQVSPPRSDIRV
jgi:MoxR-like ATPase